MSTYILITTENYDGKIGEITFYPSSGGTIYLGSVLLPYEYYTEDFYGRYSIFIPSENVTCEFRLITPTPTKTPTQTPSNTPTNTPTSTVTPTVTPTISVSPTKTPTVTPTNTSTLTPTPTKTQNKSTTVTRTPIPTRTPTKTPTPTVTSTRTPIPTQTPTPTPTPTPTNLPLPVMCFTYYGLGNIGTTTFSCEVTAENTLHNGKNCWSLTSCPTGNPLEPCPSDTGFIWWDSGSNVWYYTPELGDDTTRYSQLYNPGELPIQIMGTYEWGNYGMGTCNPQMLNSVSGPCVPVTQTPTPTPTITPTTTNPSCLCVEVVISQTDIDNAVKNTIGPFDNTVFFEGAKQSNCDGGNINYQFTSSGTYHFCVKSGLINTLTLFYYFENVPQYYPLINSYVIVSTTGCSVDSDCGINPSPTPTPTLTPTPSSTPIYVRYNMGSCCPKLPGGIMDVPSVYGIGDVILATNGYCYTINEIGTRPPTLVYSSSYIDCETCLIENNNCPTPTPTSTQTPTPTVTPTTPSNLFCFGYLYNFYAITGTTSQSLTSSNDWSVPTKSDFDTLVAAVSNDSRALRLVDTTTYWSAGNTNATNSSGFGGIGNGVRNSLSFINQKIISLYKTKTPYDSTSDYNLVLSSGSLTASVQFGSSRENGGPVRLVKNSTLLSPGQTGTYTGNDGKVYSTICIGTQEWMSQDLREEMYRNFTTIPNVTDQTTWGNLTTGAYCIYNNDPNNVNGCPETYL